MNGLVIHQLQSGYGNKIVLDEFSLIVKPNETLVLMGTSGSGKSTLLLTIIGIITPKKGSILLNERYLNTLAIEERNIGFVPQDYGLFPHLNVMENISYGARIRGLPREEQTAVAREMLKLVDLKGYEEHRVNELSGGQRQRIALARALAIKPGLLLLDEPLANIDQVTKFEVASQLKELFRKLDIPIILVTHNHEDAIFLAEHLAIVVDGKIVQTGTVEEVMKKPKTDFVRRLLMPFDGMKKPQI